MNQLTKFFLIVITFLVVVFTTVIVGLIFPVTIPASGFISVTIIGALVVAFLVGVWIA